MDKPIETPLWSCEICGEHADVLYYVGIRSHPTGVDLPRAYYVMTCVACRGDGLALARHRFTEKYGRPAPSYDVVVAQVPF